MLVYNLVLKLYVFAIRIASLWLPKARLWVDGRKDIFARLGEAISPEDRIIWIHVASLGEFEQGRPIIEKIKREHSEYKILLTFFSPSGYEIRKGYEGADYIFYLPIDTSRNARRFLDITHPEIAIFVKYEFWLNILGELKKRGAKSYIVSSIFRRNSIFFKPYGGKWRKILSTFETIFVQDEASKELLNELGQREVVVAGDSRFDRVAEIAKNAKRVEIIELFKGDRQLMVVGSSWGADEEILIPLMAENPNYKFIIAPHEINKERISSLMESLSKLNAVKYSESTIGQTDLASAQVLVLDTMGMLSSIYAYGETAYIGGGFGVGIHNTLEAATFGLPIAFGTNYQKFKEARDMIAIGACYSVCNLNELRAWFAPLRDNAEHRTKVSALARSYTASMFGATDIIVETIFKG